jgi:hypothetical protein
MKKKIKLLLKFNFNTFIIFNNKLKCSKILDFKFKSFLLILLKFLPELVLKIILFCFKNEMLYFKLNLFKNKTFKSIKSKTLLDQKKIFNFLRLKKFNFVTFM